MSDFWAGVLLGFLSGIVASIFANYYWELRGRFRAHANAERLVGKWTAYNVHGRNVDTTAMPGAGLTEISCNKHRLSADSHVLDVRSTDVSTEGSERHHSGNLVIDSRFPRLATRIDMYADSDEISEQRIVISRDFKTLYVFPVDTVATLGAVYGKHALRKEE